MASVMNIKELIDVIDKHEIWLYGKGVGSRANIEDVLVITESFYWKNLSEANIHNCIFKSCNFINCSFRDANLVGTSFVNSDLSNADFEGVDLRGVDFTNANLRGANFTNANLKDANLDYANLTDANLSGAIGLKPQIDFIKENFDTTLGGIIAYKTFNEFYPSPEYWKIEEGSILTESVNFDKCSLCACGINVAPLSYIVNTIYPGIKRPIWKVLIRWEWAPGICVPYASTGQIRCEKVQLLEKIDFFEGTQKERV